MALYCAVKPLPAMLPSERKVTHTVLLFVLTVGGATLPQNLPERRIDLAIILTLYLNKSCFYSSPCCSLRVATGVWTLRRKFLKGFVSKLCNVFRISWIMLRHFPRMQVCKKVKVFTCIEIFPRSLRFLEELSNYAQTFSAIYQPFQVTTWPIKCSFTEKRDS